MKKAILCILSMLYLLAASGTQISVHYCHGKFQTITLNGNPDEDACCGSKRPMKKRDCCDDKTLDIKLKGDQKSSSTKTFAFYPKTSAAIAVVSSSLSDLHTIVDEDTSFTFYKPRQRSKGISLLILNRTFRI